MGEAKISHGGYSNRNSHGWKILGYSLVHLLRNEEIAKARIWGHLDCHMKGLGLRDTGEPWIEFNSDHSYSLAPERDILSSSTSSFCCCVFLHRQCEG